MKYQVKSGGDLPETFEGCLWEEAKLFPRGELSMIIGHDGVGKTSIVCQLASQWTREDEVVFFAMLEDGEEMIKAKLKAYEADLDMCVFQPDRPDGSPDVAWSIPDDISRLEAYLRVAGATVCILDSLDAHMTPSPISHKARLALADMHGMAQRLGIPVIFLHHFNKGGTKTSVDQAIGGARGIKAAFRNIVVWGDPFNGTDFEGEEEGVRATHALGVHKNSYGPSFPERPTMVYSTRKIPHPFQPSETLLKFDLIDSTPLISPSDIYEARHQKQESVKNEYSTVTGASIATDAILTLLSERQDWVLATELEEHAIAAGSCQRTVRGTRANMARHDLIEKEKRTDAWYWRLTERGRQHCATTKAQQGCSVAALQTRKEEACAVDPYIASTVHA